MSIGIKCCREIDESKFRPWFTGGLTSLNPSGGLCELYEGYDNVFIQKSEIVAFQIPMEAAQELEELRAKFLEDVNKILRDIRHLKRYAKQS